MKKLLPINGFLYLLIIILTNGAFTQVSAQCIAPSLTFENPVLVAGTNGQVGATYKFPFVTTTADAYIMIDSIAGGATLKNIDITSTGYQHAWQPVVDGPSTPAGSKYFIRWKISFKNAGTNEYTSISCLNLSAIDVDGDNVRMREFVEAYNCIQHTHPYPSVLGINMMNTTLGMCTMAMGQVANKLNIDTNAHDTRINFDFGTTNSVMFITGAMVDNNSTGPASTDRHFSLYFKNFSNISTLPVRLLSFSGRALNNTSVQINWVTEMEVNNKQFEIQRSFDGKDFQTVAIAFSLEGSGTKAYKLTDKIPEGSPSKAYYRIKQIDIDDKYSISKIITISLEESNNRFVKLSPNPVDNEFTITLENNTTPVTAIRIVDMSGREIFRKSMAGLNTNMHRLDARQANMQKPGMYIAELLFADGSRSTQKMIKR
jgi:Secretion system C-terminal sorting domain